MSLGLIAAVVLFCLVLFLFARMATAVWEAVYMREVTRAPDKDSVDDLF